MKKNLIFDCQTLMDTVYESENDCSFLTQLRIDLHLLFCPACTAEIEKLRQLGELMKTGFLPDSPDFAEPIMKRLFEEAEEAMELKEKTEVSIGVSFKSWVIIGFFMLLALPSAFFGMNFIQIAGSEGSSFLLPLGITVGVVLTCYGALFIGSHLKELSSWFRLY